MTVVELCPTDVPYLHIVDDGLQMTIELDGDQVRDIIFKASAWLQSEEDLYGSPQGEAQPTTERQRQQCQPSRR